MRLYAWSHATREKTEFVGATLGKCIEKKKKGKQVLRELLDKRWRRRGQKMSTLEYQSRATGTLVT